MSARCIGEPVSWLRLERLRLGEVPAAEGAAIAAHLATCVACAACMERIEADEATELPPLEVREPRAADGRRAAPSRVRRLFARAGVLAAAAAVVLAVGHAWRTPDRETGGESGHARSKGDGMAFTLVRDDGEPLVEAQGVFRDGDRFKAVVTCPPGLTASFDLVVFDADGAVGPARGVSFPLEPARLFACGNAVPLPGAFRLTGSEGETVCVVWREDGEVDRGALSRSGELTDRRAMCKELRPARDGHDASGPM